MSTNKGIYTYDDFERKVQEYGFTPDQISDADRQLAKSNADAGIALLGYKNDWLNADNESAKAMAHAAAEDIRSRYGNYSGGANGGSFTPTGTAAYDDPWETAVQAQIRSLENRKFEWSPETDPMVKYYEDAYRREGERAMQDTLGALAAMTGGNASSYASAAAAQQRNYYAQQLTDKYPELYQQAYENFLAEYDRDYKMFDAYSKLSDTDYGRWYDKQQLAQQDRQLDITENQYNEQNKIALAELGMKDAQFNKDMEYKYAALEQNDQQFIKEMLYNYDMLDADTAYKYAALAQDKDIADKELQYKYDQLSEQGKQFIKEMVYKYDVLAQEDQHHQDELQIERDKIKLAYDQMDADTQMRIKELTFKYQELAAQKDYWSESLQAEADALGLERDKLDANASTENIELAFAAAEMGDFSLLKGLGINTDTYELLWNMEIEEKMKPTEEEVVGDMADTTQLEAAIDEGTFGESGKRSSKNEDGTFNMNVLLAKEKEGRPLTKEEQEALAVYHKTMGHVK